MTPPIRPRPRRLNFWFVLGGVALLIVIGVVVIGVKLDTQRQEVCRQEIAEFAPAYLIILGRREGDGDMVLRERSHCELLQDLQEVMRSLESPGPTTERSVP